MPDIEAMLLPVRHQPCGPCGRITLQIYVARAWRCNACGRIQTN